LINNLCIFGESPHPKLAQEICTHPGIQLSLSRTCHYHSDILCVQLQETVRERSGFGVQAFYPLHASDCF